MQWTEVEQVQKNALAHRRALDQDGSLIFFERD